MNAAVEGYPFVAVILVAHGGRDYTIACIESLKESTYPNFKIILVDNASPDDTREKVAARFPDIEIMTSDKNLGFAGGNNLGIRYALSLKAEYIFLLNNDTEIAPDAINHLVNTASQNKNIGAVGPMIYYFSDKTRIWSAGGIINFTWSYLKHRGIREQDRNQYNQSSDVDYLTGCAFMFPSKAIELIGFLDEGFWMYYEDADFCMRLKKKGLRIVFEPHAKVWHKISSSTGGNISRRKMLYKFQSGWKFFARYSPSPLWIVTYPLSQFIFFLAALMKR